MSQFSRRVVIDRRTTVTGETTTTKVKLIRKLPVWIIRNILEYTRNRIPITDFNAINFNQQSLLHPDIFKRIDVMEAAIQNDSKSISLFTNYFYNDNLPWLDDTTTSDEQELVSREQDDVSIDTVTPLQSTQFKTSQLLKQQIFSIHQSMKNNNHAQAQQYWTKAMKTVREYNSQTVIHYKKFGSDTTYITKQIQRLEDMKEKQNIPNYKERLKQIAMTVIKQGKGTKNCGFNSADVMQHFQHSTILQDMDCMAAAIANHPSALQYFTPVHLLYPKENEDDAQENTQKEEKETKRKRKQHKQPNRCCVVLFSKKYHTVLQCNEIHVFFT